MRFMHLLLVPALLIGRHGIESLSGLMCDKAKEGVNANHYQQECRKSNQDSLHRNSL